MNYEIMVMTKNAHVSLDPIDSATPGHVVDWFSDEKRNVSGSEVDQLPKADAVTLLELVRKEILFEPRVNQNDSERNSIDRYIAGILVEAEGVDAVYRQRIGDTLVFYTITADDEEETIDAVFDQERVVYQRFPELDIEFHVLLGKESEDSVPTGSVLVLKPS